MEANKIISKIRRLKKANIEHKEKTGSFSRTITTTVMELRSRLNQKERQKL